MRRAQRRCGSIPSEASRELQVDLVEVEVADGLQELGGAAFGLGFRQGVEPRLVFRLEGPERLDGVRPSLGPRASICGALVGPDGFTCGAARAPAGLSFGIGQGHLVLSVM